MVITSILIVPALAEREIVLDKSSDVPEEYYYQALTDVKDYRLTFPDYVQSVSLTQNDLGNFADISASGQGIGINIQMQYLTEPTSHTFTAHVTNGEYSGSILKTTLTPTWSFDGKNPTGATLVHADLKLHYGLFSPLSFASDDNIKFGLEQAVDKIGDRAKVLQKQSPVSTQPVTQTTSSPPVTSPKPPPITTPQPSPSVTSPQPSPKLPTITLYSSSVNGMSATVYGNAQSSSGKTLSNISFNWGDGQTSIGQFPQTHAYSQSGEYTITVVVTDNGLSSSATTNLVISSSTSSSITSPPTSNQPQSNTFPPPAPSGVDVTITQNSGINNNCQMSQNCFNPNTKSVNSGGTVTWYNADSVDHTVTSGNPSDSQTGTVFNSGMINSGGTFQFTFQNSGTYNYFCQVHPWMIGQVIVGNETPNPPTTVSVFVSTDKSVYSYGDTINIYGKTSGSIPNTLVTIMVRNPDGDILKIDQVSLNPDNTYTTKITASGTLWSYTGTYQVVIQYGSKDNSAQTTFYFTASSQATSNTIVDSSYVVNPGTYTPVPFSLSCAATITGSFSAHAGLGDNIWLFVFDQNNFSKYQNGQSYQYLYYNQQTGSGTFILNLNSGNYYIVLSNTYSVVSTKNVNLQASYTCN